MTYTTTLCGPFLDQNPLFHKDKIPPCNLYSITSHFASQPKTVGPYYSKYEGRMHWRSPTSNFGPTQSPLSLRPCQRLWNKLYAVVQQQLDLTVQPSGNKRYLVLERAVHNIIINRESASKSSRTHYVYMHNCTCKFRGSLD